VTLALYVELQIGNSKVAVVLDAQSSAVADELTPKSKANKKAGCLLYSNAMSL
jgi:hypothetical protein